MDHGWRVSDLLIEMKYIVDAKGRALGRVASEAAVILRGKRTPRFERHTVPEETLVIVNARHIKLTGNKLKGRFRERYSGYPGGLKRISYQTTFNKDPRELLRQAISGMIPRNRLKKHIMKNLTIYAEQK
ncbi:MAG: 50S ribosomal protein L13 [Candidatus Ryanbacteria bacterium RIFCSPHIGHO2_12_FULL_47_12b]|uniref:Large ribosomal subunit protein uL13 n=1 Tax=Candidatus Ryanbacteria bacterium RIFCSPLOWO2_02_FULL_47_14 TaxID=1802129 RepID=A0A1G2H0Y6_9BACT|nr:MAG: 50S ribosomal protein L13 [Candidatus Ryanbacteria bacterium RIFCSPHIGHO2_01_FULL_48_80]OGZ48174.1 MAG: 50S ribosomal protein L13 [Candidatus Ryanbacteria bacterium RIFCSPHIGHO2_02_FULL_47_25]OGZ51796.1 MAG: 50S ribosomal protein L13 [Candidatus Ryanbacteria bacterium RIFCSPLOWO2_01_FULL_47_79]OGZ51991.1 MAG: 50S ribosomal protein L13 [Candidatus Ryanbacteria bacterium RIFCSPHIGHO2_12_FULL_47_12b]OGZ56124.1 MAG: 50S ribosomal protein L13 [Candidatus Ryanbacteria bacterium RIFCSPLOWO2_02